MDTHEIALWVIASCAMIGAGLGVLNRFAIRDIHTIMNSRLDELVKVATEKAFLSGSEHGRLAEAQRIIEHASRPDA